MPSTIFLTDDQKARIVEAAIKCGFRVSRGRGSQLALLVVMAANKACTGQAAVSPPEDPTVKSSDSGDEPEPL